VNTAQHEALCETLIGRPCNCPARVLTRVAVTTVAETELALAKAIGRIHELEWRLAEPAQAGRQTVLEGLVAAMDYIENYCREDNGTLGAQATQALNAVKLAGRAFRKHNP
jgi:hypothetical protein